MVRQIFNEIVKQNEFTPEAWRRRGKCWKLPPDMLFASAVQTVHDKYCTAGCTQDLTKSKQKIRRDSEALTKQKTILRRTE